MKGYVKSVNISGAKSSLRVSKTMQLKAVIKATKGASKSVQWISNNTKYATVTNKGLVKALSAGKGKTVKITVKSTDGTNKSKTVSIKIN